MKKIKLALPLPPSVNHCYQNTKHRGRMLTDEGRNWKFSAGVLARQALVYNEWYDLDYLKNKKIVMEFSVFWKDKRRRDCDNLLKLTQDSFSEILYPDDHMVLPRIIDFFYDKDNPRIEITVYPKDRIKTDEIDVSDVL